MRPSQSKSTDITDEDGEMVSSSRAHGTADWHGVFEEETGRIYQFEKTHS